MAAVRQRESNDAGASRRVRRRGIEHVPARPASASAVLSSDSDANPTQSQAASWHPSQIRPGWFIRGSGVDVDTDDEPHGRSQPEAAAGANAPPVAASQSAAQPRCLLNAAARQAAARGDLASQRPGHEVPVAHVAAAVGVSSDAPRRLTRSLTRHALRRARTDDDVPADDAAVQVAGEDAVAAQQNGAAQPLLQHSRLLSHGSLADSGLPSSQEPGAPHHPSDSQRTGGSGSAAPPAAAAQGGASGCATATGMQRITRFFSPLTGLMGTHGSQQQSQAGTAAAMAAEGPPPRRQDEAEDGTAPNEVTSAERRMASQPVASRDRGLAERSPSRVPPSQLAFLDREGLEPSQHSIEVSLSAPGPALPNPGVEHEAAAAGDAACAAPSQHQVSGQGREDDRHTESIPPAAGETAAYGAASGAPHVTGRILDLRRNLGVDYVESIPLDVLEVLWDAENKALEEAAAWDTDLELSLYEVRLSLALCFSGFHSGVTFTWQTES